MPAINQSKQPSTGGGTYQETPEQKEAWRKLRAHMRSLNLGVGDTFTVKGTIAKVLLDGTADNPRYFTKKQVKDDRTEYDWPFVKVMAAITDPAFGTPGTLDFPAKNVGASFFDGVTKKGRNPNRGGMYNLHVAVTGEEPGEALKAGHGSWDTEDYENKPLLLRLVYQGKEEEGSAYADRRLGMKLFIAGFEKDRDVHRAVADLDDEDDGDEIVPFAAPSPSAAVVAARQNADLAATPATDRQLQFLGTLARELGMGNVALDDFAVEIVGHSLGVLTRKQASTVIDALQRERVKDVAPEDRPARKDEGTGELVGVGVSKKPLEDDDTDF